MVNNTEVAAPPSMTSRHSIRTSGRNLYIAENKPVMMTKETTKFRTCKTTSCAGRMEADNAPSAAIHADRGTSMTSKPVALMLADLGVTKTHSRPHVSDDNPYSESQFKTLKYRPEFPE